MKFLKFTITFKRGCQKSVLAKIAIWLSKSYKLKNAVFGTFDTPSFLLLLPMIPQVSNFSPDKRGEKRVV